MISGGLGRLCPMTETMAVTPFSTATDAAQLVRAGQVSSRELTEQLLARIEAVDPALNAVVELRADAALADADAADAAIAAGAAGPLLGVPITVKESFNVAGLHATWGNPAFGTTSPDQTRLSSHGSGGPVR